VTIPEEEELRGVDQRKRWGEIRARLNKDLETGGDQQAGTFVNCILASDAN